MAPDIVAEYLARLSGHRGETGSPQRPASKAAPATGARRNRSITAALVDERAADAPAAISVPAMGDTAVVDRDHGTAAETRPGYMRLVAEAGVRRQAEQHAAAGKSAGSNPSDGKRSLATWHAPDSYAFGVVLWQVLTLRQPWAGVAVMHEIWIRVQRGERPPVTAADEAGAPAGFVALMRELWAQDPVARPTFAEALRRLRAMLAAAGPPPTEGSGGGELDLVSDLFASSGGGSDDKKDAVLLRSLQCLSSTPTATDYARTLGHASVVDLMMAGGGGRAEGEGAAAAKTT